MLAVGNRDVQGMLQVCAARFVVDEHCGATERAVGGGKNFTIPMLLGESNRFVTPRYRCLVVAVEHAQLRLNAVRAG